jgi:hypothetical protein
MATTTEPTVMRGYDTPALAAWFGLPDWRIRREIQYAESIGEIHTQRVGHCLFLPVDELARLRRWMVRRGLVEETPAETT